MSGVISVSKFDMINDRKAAISDLSVLKNAVVFGNVFCFERRTNFVKEEILSYMRTVDTDINSRPDDIFIVFDTYANPDEDPYRSLCFELEEFSAYITPSVAMKVPACKLIVFRVADKADRILAFEWLENMMESRRTSVSEPKGYVWLYFDNIDNFNGTDHYFCSTCFRHSRPSGVISTVVTSDFKMCAKNGYTGNSQFLFFFLAGILCISVLMKKGRSAYLCFRLRKRKAVNFYMSLYGNLRIIQTLFFIFINL